MFDHAKVLEAYETLRAALPGYLVFVGIHAKDGGAFADGTALALSVVYDVDSSDGVTTFSVAKIVDEDDGSVTLYGPHVAKPVQAD